MTARLSIRRGRAWHSAPSMRDGPWRPVEPAGQGRGLCAARVSGTAARGRNPHPREARVHQNRDDPRRLCGQAGALGRARSRENSNIVVALNGNRGLCGRGLSNGKRKAEGRPVGNVAPPRQCRTGVQGKRSASDQDHGRRSDPNSDPKPNHSRDSPEVKSKQGCSIRLKRGGFPPVKGGRVGCGPGWPVGPLGRSA
jgi:hypothetical protein